MRITGFNHPHSLLSRKIIFLLTLIAASASPVIAQNGDRLARAAQWESYQLPEGQFVRFVDRQKGFSFWHPVDWVEQPGPAGNHLFKPAQQGANLLVMTDDIPDGYGLASYASGALQGLRNQPVDQDSVTVRREMLGGLEWRELSYDFETPGGTAHQTMWLAAVGARAYVFVLSVAPDELEKYEPILKRVLMSVRIGSAGHWNEDFENLRLKFVAGNQPAASDEIVASVIANDLRTARLSFNETVVKLTDLSGQAPALAFDLATDADPQVRLAAITAIGRTRQNSLAIEALVWALTDKDVLVSTAAAESLASGGVAGRAAIKNSLASLAETPSAIVRAGLAFGNLISGEWIAELLRSENSKHQLAALQLALALPQLDWSLPYPKLLSSPDLAVRYSALGVLQRHRPTDAAAELVGLLRGESEAWAARALGEVAPVNVRSELDKRIAEIDARLAALGKANQTRDRKSTAGKRKTSQSPGNQTDKQDGGQADSADSLTLLSPAAMKTMPEDARLFVIRYELNVASGKISFRDRWNNAKDDVARRALYAEIGKDPTDVSEWARNWLNNVSVNEGRTPIFDASKLPSAPSTGESLFPKNTISYVMAPDLAATMEKLDAALSGVQMATVRDQMTFALILKLLKTTLADKTGVSATGDPVKATGIDLKSPIALGSWTAETEGAEKKNSVVHSALVLRVVDRARFERTMTAFQDQIGDLNSFSTIASALSRFAGLLPAAVPVIAAAITSDEARRALSGKVSGASFSSRPAMPSLTPFACLRQEKIGELPVSVFEKRTITQSGRINWETAYLAYLNDTAIIASSKAAMTDLIATAYNSRPSISQTESFARASRQQGEMVFFSDLPSLIESAFDGVDSDEDDLLRPILKAFGAESGTLRISPTLWETTFDISLAENEFTGSFKTFKASTLAAPHELLPQSTMLYAGAMIDPAKMLSVMKKLEASSISRPKARVTIGTEQETAEARAVRGQEIDDAIEKQIAPQMHGEIAVAIISFKPFFDSGQWPAMVFAAKLKSGGLANDMRSGRLFPNLKRLPEQTALGSPVIAFGDDDTSPYVAVTNDYFLLADSIETLKLLEAKKKFSSSRDFTRSLENVPDNLALFATYNLEAAFEEASKVLTGSESQQLLPFVSALVHAFHSQRAFVTLERDGWRGHLSVSFDREGRYSVGDLAGRTGDFDVANAIISPKGLNVIESSRVEAMRLRVVAKRPGVAPRVSQDLSQFPFQRIESNGETIVVVTTAARKIPDNLTVRLPVTGAEFAKFLAPTAQINSVAPQIVALANQIAGGDRDGHSVARKIGEWTYRNLKWKKVESDAVDTLASREADCLEHSELYVALARSLGLPARVVTGAALSGGSFGAHAWVEVYLGKWVELDPTWGLMDHVDATHLRFDGDAFTSYAMLNQIELEITSARHTVADFQGDPIRLINEFSLDESTRDLAFDLPLTVEQTIGAERWEKLDEKQRAAVIKAFERTVNEMWETWDPDLAEPVRVLRREDNDNRAALTILRGDDLLRLTLAKRDGAWFITEHEIVDDALPEFSDALSGALQPEIRRGRIFETSIEAAMKHIDRLIAIEGEKPELLLLKVRVFSSQQNEATGRELLEKLKEKKERKDKAGNQSEQVQPASNEPSVDRAVELLKEITRRWPNFAQAHLALGRELLYTFGDEALSPLSKDAEQAVAALNRYAELVPDDPRVWRDLAQAFEQMEKYDEAEKAYRAAIERDNTYLEHHAALVTSLLDREEMAKAKTAFAAMLKVSPDTEEAFAYLDDEEGFDLDAAKIREELLLAFPKEIAASKTALTLLGKLQEAQNKIGEAIKSIKRAIAIEAEAEDYETLSRLYRQQRRFTEALSAANKGLTLDDSATYIQFERACSLAQLGRKREAVAALKLMLEAEPPVFFDDTEPDLQPLATSPDFKALKSKMKQAASTLEEKPEETAKPEKTPNSIKDEKR
ncbi:MAG: transglutaminase domain-containing protein [Blastocatellales bacterium]